MVIETYLMKPNAAEQGRKSMRAVDTNVRVVWSSATTGTPGLRPDLPTLAAAIKVQVAFFAGRGDQCIQRAAGATESDWSKTKPAARPK